MKLIICHITYDDYEVDVLALNCAINFYLVCNTLCTAAAQWQALRYFVRKAAVKGAWWSLPCQRGPHIRNPWKDPFRQMTLTSWVRDIRSSGGSRYVRGPWASPCPASMFTLMSWICNLCVLLSGSTTGCPKKSCSLRLGKSGHFWASLAILGTFGTLDTFENVWEL